MSCCNDKVTSCGGSGYVLVLVLYILLAIILGGALTC